MNPITSSTYEVFVFVVARGQSDADVAASETVEENSDLGIVGEDVQDISDGNFSPAPGVETVYVFPKNSARCENLKDTFCVKNLLHYSLENYGLKFVLFFPAVVTAGEETELLVGMKNNGNEIFLEVMSC